MSDEKGAQQIMFGGGADPAHRRYNNTDEMIKKAVDTSLSEGLIKCGDLIVITAGVPVGVPFSNLIKVHIVGRYWPEDRALGIEQ